MTLGRSMAEELEIQQQRASDLGEQQRARADRLLNEATMLARVDPDSSTFVTRLRRVAATVDDLQQAQRSLHEAREITTALQLPYDLDGPWDGDN